MVSPPSHVTIRFSRRELALVFEGVDFMALPEDPDDQRTVLHLRDVLLSALNDKAKDAIR